MYGGCDTCKHSWGEENCKGCLWDGKSQTNTHWEPEESFINKPCVSEGACHEDKMKVLGKIKAEIMKLDDINPDYPMDRTIHISRNEVLEIIDKYMKESEG